MYADSDVLTFHHALGLKVLAAATTIEYADVVLLI